METDEVVNAIQLLRTKIEQTKQGDFQRFKKEISELLEEEIGFHYGLHHGRFQISVQKVPIPADLGEAPSYEPNKKKFTSDRKGNRTNKQSKARR